MAELILNGILEEETGKFYHLYCFTDQQGPVKKYEDNYVFIPKSVCCIVDYYTISVQDWYVRKKGLDAFIKKISVKMVKPAVTPTPRSRPKTAMDKHKAMVDAMIQKLGRKQAEEILKKKL